MEGLFGFKGIKIALFLSLMIALSLCIFFFAINAFIGGLLFIMLAFESYKMWKSALSMSPQDQNQQLQTQLRKAEDFLRFGKHDEAFDLLQSVRVQAKEGILFIAATQHLADIYFEKENYQEVIHLLEPIQNQIDQHALNLLQQSMFKTGNWQGAILIGNELYQTTPQAETALINAMSHAMLEEEQPTIGWLQCALRSGLDNVQDILKKKEFDKIRNSPKFKHFTESL